MDWIRKNTGDQKEVVIIIIRTIVYSVKQAFRQISRNRTMMFTSLFSITAMMLILGLFFMLAVNIDVLSQRAEEQFDMVELYLKDSVSDTERMELSEKIGAMECVETVQYVSKEKALKIMKKRWGNNGYLLDGLSSNPLPASLQVKMKTIGKTAGFVKTIRKEKGVEDVACRQDEIDKIMKITEHIQIGVVIVIFFLIIVSVVVVANTIRLTVLARGSAISIMKYVGATNWFIRAPFLMEGIIIGVAAALLSALIVSGLYEAFADHYSEKFLVMLSMQLLPVSSLAGKVTAIFLGLGISIGAVGSIISMRRFLET